MHSPIVGGTRRIVSACLLAAFLLLGDVAQAQPSPPPVGSVAADFSLPDVAGATIRLAEERRRGPVVIVVGRGWPGYQCPFCTRQFAEFRSRAAAFQAAGARVLWIYPGPADALAQHAADFVSSDPLPPNVRVLLDPGYTFTTKYGLRWDAPKETAYPATFVIDRSGTIRFAEVSLEHGGRTPVARVLQALERLAR